MPAYVLFIREEPVSDAAEYAVYQRMNAQAPRDPKLEPLALHGAVEALEGEAPDGVLILRFPTVADAKAWYASPAYQAALPHRMAAARYRAMIVEGL